MAEQCIDQGVVLMASAGMNNKPSRLIDNNEIIVLEQNVERNGLWLILGLFEWWLGQFDFVTAANGLAWSRRCAVEPNESGADQLLNAGAGVFRKLLCQKTIQPKPGIIF